MANEQNLRKLDSKTAAEIGAKGGRAKAGSKHLSTHIQEMLNDPNFELKLKNGEVLKGRPIEAVIKTAVAKAVSGDMRAFDMLGKYGYGNITHLNLNDNPLDKILNKFGIEGVDAREAETTEEGTS